jgi:hypothetical protein
MAAKKRRKRGPGLLWRVLFGHNGPTKGEMRKLLGLTFSKTFPVQERDAVTGRVRTRYMRVEPDGRVVEAKAPAKKKRAAPKKKPAAKPAAKGVASKSSKPSRTSKSGSTQQRQRQPAANPTPRRTRAEPMSERVLRNPDGTLAGSRKQKPVTYAQAQREYVKAMKNAAAASKHAEELLDWDQPRTRRPATRAKRGN